MDRFRPCISTVFFVFLTIVQIGSLSFSSALHERIIHINGRFFVEHSSQLQEITDISYYCIGCHDGMVAPSRGENLLAGMTHRSGVHNNHPVAISYPTGHPEFNDPGMVDPRIMITGGTLTCVSCHSYAEPSHTLTVSCSRSRLCLQCHRK